MKLRRTIGPSWRALAAHRVRAGLAFASVSIGVAAIVLTSALGAGADAEVQRKIEGMGTNLLVVRPAQVQQVVARKTIRGTVTSLSVDDYEAVARLPSLAAVAPGAEGAARVKSASSAMMATVLGTNAAYPVVRRFELAAGRFLDDDDDRVARRVAVLGARVREALFAGEAAVGQEIRVRGMPFEVIGTLAAKGVMADGSDPDSQVLIPLRTALRRMFNTRWLNAIYVSVPAPSGMQAAETAIGALLRGRHRQGSDFATQDTTRFLTLQRQATGTLTSVASGIAVLALLVGGTGILALMLLSVRERTGEIGLRMAIGARPRDILVQFLLEAAMLALGGWVAGLAMGGLGAALVGLTTHWSLGLPRAALPASLAMVLVIGLGFGSFPARKASLLPPAEALRSE